MALEGLGKKIEAVVEPDSDAEFMLFGLAAPSKDHEPLPKVAAALNGLLLIVESADAAPTADATTAGEKWEEAAVDTLARWSAFQREDLASVNAMLEKSNLKPVAIGETPAAH